VLFRKWKKMLGPIGRSTRVGPASGNIAALATRIARFPATLPEIRVAAFRGKDARAVGSRKSVARGDIVLVVAERGSDGPSAPPPVAHSGQRPAADVDIREQFRPGTLNLPMAA
jgi:hypothetical protein